MVSHSNIWLPMPEHSTAGNLRSLHPHGTFHTSPRAPTIPNRWDWQSELCTPPDYTWRNMLMLGLTSMQLSSTLATSHRMVCPHRLNAFSHAAQSLWSLWLISCCYPQYSLMYSTVYLSKDQMINGKDANGTGLWQDGDSDHICLTFVGFQGLALFSF